MANPKRTEKQWRKLVSQWERSGLSAGEFAATRSNLHPRTLTWWASKLRRDAREQQSATNDEGFLTVVVAESPAQLDGVAERQPVEVVLTNGIRLRFEHRLDRSGLGELATAFGGVA